MQQSCGNCSCYKDWALLALRLSAGVIFVAHGYAKLFGEPGMDLVIKMVTGLGFPAPVLLAYLLALTEFLGGTALILGVWTRWASGLLAFVVLTAGTLVKNWKLPMADLDLALLAMMLSIYWSGAGSCTVSKWFGKR